jgi:uncharacterized protein YyaL (SSP411 family)
MRIWFSVIAALVCPVLSLGVETKTLNHLAGESSTYLRQHATNPVDWYPWGPEALAKARAEDKPIFLSIGYATCHWCHVMEHESFENPEIAALLNAGFVPIKVDREEHPELDRVYMTFVQASTGAGGWPLSVWLTPDGKPFFGTTYCPPTTRGGRTGLKELLKRFHTLWNDDRPKLLARADEVVRGLSAASNEAAASKLDVDRTVARALKELRSSFDAKHGGFERAPKFPQPAYLTLLLQVSATASTADGTAARSMLTKTLTEMHRGAICDQLGGGFHRYATDAEWRIPHFEKMLNDQALLASVYVSAWQLTHDDSYSETARSTLDYVLTTLAAPDGGFYAAEDADSPVPGAANQQAEGAFYLWTTAEFEQAVGAADAPIVERYFGVRRDGNAGKELRGRNILSVVTDAAELAGAFHRDEAGVRAGLEKGIAALRRARNERPRPLRDEQRLTTWNALMASALARAGQAFGDERYVAAARQTIAWIQSQRYDARTRRLKHSVSAVGPSTAAFAEDYAFLIAALLDVYEATFDTSYLAWAAQLQKTQLEMFWDPRAGGFYASTSDEAAVVIRLKEDQDAAEPSASSVSVLNLGRLAALLHRDDWRTLAVRCGEAFASQLDRAPTALAFMVPALGYVVRPPQEIVIQGEPGAPATAALLARVNAHYLPTRALLLVDRDSRAFFAGKLEMVDALPTLSPDEAKAYVCENFVCQQPTSDPAQLERLLTARRQ